MNLFGATSVFGGITLQFSSFQSLVEEERSSPFAHLPVARFQHSTLRKLANSIPCFNTQPFASFRKGFASFRKGLYPAGGKFVGPQVFAWVSLVFASFRMFSQVFAMVSQWFRKFSQVSASFRKGLYPAGGNICRSASFRKFPLVFACFRKFSQVFAMVSQVFARVSQVFASFRKFSLGFVPGNRFVGPNTIGLSRCCCSEPKLMFN